MKKTLLSLAFCGAMISPVIAQNDTDEPSSPSIAEPVAPQDILDAKEIERIVAEALQEAEKAMKEAEIELREAHERHEISSEEMEIAQEELRIAVEELQKVDMEAFAAEMAEIEKEIAQEMEALNDELMAMNIDLSGCMTDYSSHRKFQYELVRELARDGFIDPNDHSIEVEFKKNKVEVNGEQIEDEVLRKKYLDMKNDYSGGDSNLKLVIDLGDC